jgi:Na+/H+ antiporter NhaD/arsenite permease-like protein
VVVFFIFLVANIGGSLTPLGDPPLFLGFLHGVSFFWTTEHMLAPMLVCVAVLLALFFVIDTVLMNREDPRPEDEDPEPEERLGIEGGINFLFLLGVIAAILYSGYQSRAGPYWDQEAYEAAEPEMAAAQLEVDRAEIQVGRGEAPVETLLSARVELNRVRGAAEHHAIRGIHISEHVTWPYINLVRDGILVLMGILSLMVTSRGTRRANDFTWFPIVEVAKLFSGIFVTIIPAIAILKAGPEGVLRAVVMAVTKDSGQAADGAYFWLTGGLSSFLDNAPTYLVFFNTAGGDAATLMTSGATTLLAISAGAVFMGAMTYIGNAPNFMVRSIAEESGIPMPSFFGYMIRWSVPVLIPTFILVTQIFFL